MLALASLVPGILASLLVAAEPENTLTPQVLWEIDRIGAPLIAPCGTRVIAPVTEYDIKENKGETRLWLFPIGGEGQRPLTQKGSSAGQAVFSPCGSRLAFVTRRDGDEAGQIYLLPMDGPGEAERLSEIPTGVSAMKWAGDHLYFISRVWPQKSWEEMAEAIKAQRESKMSARTWSAMPFSHFDHWIDEEREAHIFRIPAAGGDVQPITLGSGRQLSRSSTSDASYDIAPDESRVAFAANSIDDPIAPNFDIFVIVPGERETINVSPDNPAGDGSPLFSPDGSKLAYTRQAIRGFYGDTRRLVVHDFSGGRAQSIASQWDRSADGLRWAPCGTKLYGSIDDEAARRIYRFTLDGAPPQRVTDGTSYTALDIAQDGTMVAINQSFLHPPQLVIVDSESGEARRIDRLNDGLLADVRLGRYESVTYAGANGAPVQMWVHYPPDFDASKTYPLFLLIHGGPHGAMIDSFHYRWNAQTFASWGYVTAWPNFHGSSGFGQDFVDAINPDWMTLPYEDVVRAGEWFAQQPWIDAQRMVAGGGSYGGYLSSVLLGKPHPFQALVIHSPVYNMYSQMSADFAVHGVRFGGYWEDPSIYQTISPHYLAKDFRTPALISHGQLDYRVPVGQSFEIFRTLQTKGIESRMIYFPDENHWILKPQNSLYWYAQVRKWIDRFTGSGAAQSEPASSP